MKIYLSIVVVALGATTALVACKAQVEDSLWRAENARIEAESKQREADKAGNDADAAKWKAISDRLSAEIARTKELSSKPATELGDLGEVGSLAGLVPWGGAALLGVRLAFAEFRRHKLAKGLDSLIDGFGLAKETSPTMRTALKENERVLDKTFTPFVHNRIAARRARVKITAASPAPTGPSGPERS